MYGYNKTLWEVTRIGLGISACARNADEMAVLVRFLTHKRMNAVWKELLAEKRTSGYLHPAVGGAASARGPVYAQQQACGKLLSYAFSTICNPVQVSKWSETEEYREKLLADAAKYRQVADDLAANGLVDPAADGGAAALLRLAQAKEEETRRTLALTRTRGDPLVIDKDRGDRAARGVSTMLAMHLRELFGENLYGVAAILTEVGLGEKVSRRVVRSSLMKGPRE